MSRPSVTYAREFRYDSGRARYLVRELDPDELEQGTYDVESDVWSDYAASPGGAGDPGAPGTFGGDAIYGDYTISGGNFVNARSFEPGMATVDPWASSGGDNTEYFHTNHLGTTRFMSDPDGDPADAAVYTAFGERVSGTNHRYGYAGAYGYQAHDFPESPDDPIPYLHVGARYYDPASGRFLQRDPIGIHGGLNVYAYVMCRPTLAIDPDGLWSWFDIKVRIAKGVLVITGGDDSWLDDPVKVRKGQRIAGGVAVEAVVTACGVGVLSHAAKLRHLRWLNTNRYVRIGSGRTGGGWNRRIVIGGGKGRIHIPITRPRPIPTGGIPR